MDRWSGKVALVTGASSGIGAAVSRALVHRGMIVIGCARRVDKIEAIAEEKDFKLAPGKLVAIKCDLRKESEILALFKEIKNTHKRLDVCVNNAGVGHDSSLLEGKTEEWREILDVNVLALSICTREAVKLMQETEVKEGQIIHIGSFEGYKLSHHCPGIHFYGGVKWMVRALTESLRMELKASKSGIRTASISPSLTETEFLEKCFKDNPGVDAEEIFASIQPIQAKDVAHALVYILGTPPHVEVHDILMRPTALTTY